MAQPKGCDERGIVMPKNYKANENLRSNSHELRKNMTPQEKHLWYDFLNSYGISFRRQVVIGNYIVDFYCRKAKLAIEIDGAQHYVPDSIEYDKERTEYLENCGIRVLRFLNNDIDRNFENSCAYIDQNVKQRLGLNPSSASFHSAPSPLGRLNIK